METTPLQRKPECSIWSLPHYIYTKGCGAFHIKQVLWLYCKVNQEGLGIQSNLLNLEKMRFNSLTWPQNVGKHISKELDFKFLFSGVDDPVPPNRELPSAVSTLIPFF